MTPTKTSSDSEPDDLAIKSELTGRFRANGAFLVIGSLGICATGWLALAKLAENLSKNPELAADIAPLGLRCIEYRAWLPVLTVPPLLAGAWLLGARRTRSMGRLLTIASSLWLFVLFGLVLCSFVMFIAPLYQYRPL